MTQNWLGLRAGLVSLALFVLIVGIWHIATAGTGTAVKMDPEYAKLMGATATQGKSAMPGPAEVGAKIWQHLKDPFYDRGTNDKGIGIQLAYSIARVGLGYLLAVAVAIPVGFLIGMSPLMSRRSTRSSGDEADFAARLDAAGALHHQGLRHLRHLRDLHLLAVADAEINTAFGVATVRRDWLNVAKTLEMSPGRTAGRVILRRPRPPSSRACASPSASPGW
jgi:nitrate/nitrite transport system permease protein